MATTTYRTRPIPGAAASGAGELGAGALVIHCSDPRYQPHFQEFLRAGLGLHGYALMAVPGGAHALTLTEYLPKFSWVGWRWVRFLGDLVQPSRVVLIGHDDCRWYQDARFQHLHGGCDEAQHGDLRRVKSEMQLRFPSAVVEAWFARLDGPQAHFQLQ